ncbi:MAG: hypothetical protein ACF8PN_17305 [Phycisphaerales bacterium]
MKQYEVVERVPQYIVRERRWVVEAISEQDAIRQVLEFEASDGYRGERSVIEKRDAAQWVVDGAKITYDPNRAVPEDNELVDTGGGD